MIMSNSTYNQLTANLELLKLTQMKLHLDEIRDFTTKNGLSFTEGLLKLSNNEVDYKEQKRFTFYDKKLRHFHLLRN